MENKITGAIIVAAGEGIRSKSTIPKQYLDFGHKMILEKNIENFINEPLIDFVLVVINEKHIALYNKAISKISSSKLLTPCYGGKTRTQSVKNGLKMISNIGCKKILIQDGARPFTSNKIIKSCIEGLDQFDVVFPGLEISDTIYIHKNQNNRKTIDKLGPNRNAIIRAQTPQAFHFDYIYERHLSSKEEYTDDVSLAFLDEKKIEIISGSEYNLKVTTPEDIKIAEKLFLNV